MKNEPCIRFGMRISPKISEKPAERRNSKPPSARLFTPSVSQSVIGYPPPREPREGNHAQQGWRGRSQALRAGLPPPPPSAVPLPRFAGEDLACALPRIAKPLAYCRFLAGG